MRRRDFILSILKGEGGSTYDAIGDAAYSERLVELEKNMIAISIYGIYL